MDAKAVLLVALGVFAVFYLVVFTAGLRRAPPDGPVSGAKIATGFVTNFFDTLGIGSFATTTSIFRFWKLVPDERIPGTLNVGHTLPTIAEAFIFTRLIPVDARTLVLMIAASIAGAWLGAGVVARWSRRKVRIGMGWALIAAAALLVSRQLHLTPSGGAALGLTGWWLVVGLAGNFALGALMTLGIGLYAPCMILVSLLGMDPKVAFPIMMGSCAFLMPVGSVRFIREGRYALSAAVGLALGGLPAVLLAAYVVRSLPLGAVRWLVIVVVVYTAVALLRAAQRERRGAGPSAATAPGP